MGVFDPQKVVGSSNRDCEMSDSGVFYRDPGGLVHTARWSENGTQRTGLLWPKSGDRTLSKTGRRTEDPCRTPCQPVTHGGRRCDPPTVEQSPGRREVLGGEENEPPWRSDPTP